MSVIAAEQCSTAISRDKSRAAPPAQAAIGGGRQARPRSWPRDQQVPGAEQQRLAPAAHTAQPTANPARRALLLQPPSLADTSTISPGQSLQRFSYHSATGLFFLLIISRKVISQQWIS